MPHISTHILDIAKGKPAAGVAVDLYSNGNLIASAITNPEGRAQLVTADSIPPGAWELVFQVEKYLQPNPFFDRITLRFLVSDEAANYHVPLLLAPHGYSTYRGS